MEELIKRIDELQSKWITDWHGNKDQIATVICLCRDVKEIIQSSQSDGQQKEPCEYTQIDDECNAWECSKCDDIWMLNAGTPKDNNMNYCPNCGRQIQTTSGTL